MEINVIEKVPESEFSQPFAQGMYDRMAMSWFKYGFVKDAYPHKVNAIQSLLIRLVRYMGPDAFQAAVTRVLTAMPDIEKAKHQREAGNTEYLMDAANFAMIEFMYPSLPNAHFTPTDSSASPGRMGALGTISQTSNDHDREQTRTGRPFYDRQGD